jgi:DNA-binding GntR family transcriptional regulator
VTVGGRTAGEHLQVHIEKHAPKPGPAKGTAKAEAGAGMLQRVVTTLTDRIRSGELRPGQTLLQNPLADDLQVSRHFVAAGIEQLMQDGLLAYKGASYVRRVVVAPRVDKG